MEQILETKFPDYYKTVIVQWECASKNWFAFHNRFTKDNITRILSLRDYQIAMLAAQGESNKKIAAKFYLSEDYVRNIKKISTRRF